MARRRSSTRRRGEIGHVRQGLYWRTRIDDCSMLIDDDIDAIIRRGEERTAELNAKYQGLDLDALNNFRSESLVNQWEGEDYTAKVSHRRS